MRAKPVIKVLVTIPALYGAFWLYRQVYPPRPPAGPGPLPRISSELSRELTEAHGKLTARLLRDQFQAQPSENFVISPAGLYEVGALLSLGTKGASRRAVADLFPLTRGNDPLRAAAAGYRERRNELANRGVVEFASSLWTEVKLAPNFLKEVQTTFGNGARATRFPDPAGTDIGAWTSKITKTPTPQSGPTRPATNVAAFVSAGRFKDSWSVKFDRGDTRSRAFTLADGKDVLVPTMAGDEKTYGFKEGKDLFALTLPFRNGLEFLALVPQKSMADMFKSPEFDEALGRRWWTRPSKGRVQMPKWSVKRTVQLRPILTRLGMGRLFDSDAAPDFAPMGAEVWLGESKQEVAIEIDEDGAEAYTYTSIFFEAKASKPRPKNFIIDQPFVFAIRDPEGLIFFAGIVMDPR